jgi:hypothetical protein
VLIATIPEGPRNDLKQATEAFDQASNARETAWDRRNRYTVGEIERAKNGWRHAGEKAP